MHLSSWLSAAARQRLYGFVTLCMSVCLSVCLCFCPSVCQSVWFTAWNTPASSSYHHHWQTPKSVAVLTTLHYPVQCFTPCCMNHKVTNRLNPLWAHQNRRATDHYTAVRWLVHWPLVGGYYIWYSKEGPGPAVAPPSPLIAVPNVTVHPSTVSVPTYIIKCGTIITCAH